MEKETNFNKKDFFWRRALQGAGIATFLVFMITETVVGVKAPGSRWTILSILMVPVAGALGGLLFHLMEPLRKRGEGYNILANSISIIGFLLFLGLALYLV